MKLGKKKNTDAPVDEKPANKKAKSGKKTAAGPKLKNLGSVAVSQSVVVILAGVLIAVLLQLFIVQPSASKQLEIQKAVEADAAALRLNHYLESMQRSVNSLAKRPDIIAAVSERSGIAAAKNALEASLPGIEGVHLFSYRDIPRTTQGNAFANVDRKDSLASIPAGNHQFTLIV